MLKKLGNAANDIVRACTWKDLALVKLCMLAFGGFIGLCVPKKHRPAAFFVTVAAFAATYIPLMRRFFPLMRTAVSDFSHSEKDTGNDEGIAL